MLKHNLKYHMAIYQTPNSASPDFYNQKYMNGNSPTPNVHSFLALTRNVSSLITKLEWPSRIQGPLISIRVIGKLFIRLKTPSLKLTQPQACEMTGCFQKWRRVSTKPLKNKDNRTKTEKWLIPQACWIMIQVTYRKSINDRIQLPKTCHWVIEIVLI